MDRTIHCRYVCAILAGIGAAGPAVRASAQEEAPQTVQLTGIVRDFRECTVEGGHPDFEHEPQTGFGRYAGNVSTTLDEEGKPFFVGPGFKIAQQWRDSAHRVICPCLYDEALGDIEGQSSQTSTAGITSADSFAQWFRDTPGTNMSTYLTITLTRQPNGMYVFDSDIDQPYEDLGGFFPIDDQLFGNSGGNPDHNYHFSFELHAEFTYEAENGLNFKFIGSDSVWVYINGQLVIDLEGVHAALDQYVDLNRLNLVDGQRYPLDFYFAQRYRPQSDFRVQTNIILDGQAPSTILSQFD
jgi:fibro-slime domain-containing protein